MPLCDNYAISTIDQHYVGLVKREGNVEGIGIASIRNITEKYNGVIKISYDNNIFQVYVMLNKLIKRDASY